MNAAGGQIKVEIGFSPEVFIAMEMVGLEGEKLVKETKQATAIDLFRQGLLSIGKAAELAEMCLSDFMDLLVENGIAVAEYDIEDLEKDRRAFERLAQ